MLATCKSLSLSPCNKQQWATLSTISVLVYTCNKAFVFLSLNSTHHQIDLQYSRLLNSLPHCSIPRKEALFTLAVSKALAPVAQSISCSKDRVGLAGPSCTFSMYRRLCPCTVCELVEKVHVHTVTYPRCRWGLLDNRHKLFPCSSHQTEFVLSGSHRHFSVLLELPVWILKYWHETPRHVYNTVYSSHSLTLPDMV